MKLQKYRRGVVSAAFILTGAFMFVSAPAGAVQQTTTGRTTQAPNVPNSTTIFADLNQGVNAKDVGDVWFVRTAGATAGTETLTAQITLNGSAKVTSGNFCIRATSFSNALDAKTCDYIKGIPANAQSVQVNVPAGLVGKTIWANLAVGVDGKDAYAQWHGIYQNMFGAYGNAQIPTIGSSVHVICPASFAGRVLNVSYYLNGQPVSNLTNLANGEVTAKFSVAPGCSNQQVSFAKYYAKSTVVTPDNVNTQKLIKAKTGTFSQAAVQGDYTLNAFAITLESNCIYQLDLNRGGVETPPSYQYTLFSAGLGGSVDCRNGLPTTTTKKPTTTTTAKPTTTTEAPTVLPTVIQNTTTTAAPVVMGETLAKTGVETTGLGLMGFGFVTAGTGVRQMMRQRLRKGGRR